MTGTLIVCLGNPLAADDGAGHAVYLELGRTPLPEEVRLVFLGLGGIDLLTQLAGERRLVVVDAVQLGEAPGTVHLLGWDQLPVQRLRPVSGHGIGIREAIEVGRRLYPETVPDEIYLVGIEGECFDQLGEGLSPPVEAAVGRATALVRELWPGNGNCPGPAACP